MAVIYYGAPERLYRAIDFCIDTLEIDDIEIDITIGRPDDGFHGELHDFDSDERTCEIELCDGLDDSWERRAAFHELVHVKQMSEGRLRIHNGQIFWEGRPFCTKGKLYEDQPWEREAYEQEQRLVDAYNALQI